MTTTETKPAKTPAKRKAAPKPVERRSRKSCEVKEYLEREQEHMLDTLADLRAEVQSIEERGEFSVDKIRGMTERKHATIDRLEARDIASVREWVAAETAPRMDEIRDLEEALHAARNGVGDPNPPRGLEEGHQAVEAALMGKAA